MATEILTFIGSIDTNSEVKMNGPVRDGLNPGGRADVIRLYKKSFFASCFVLSALLRTFDVPCPRH